MPHPSRTYGLGASDDYVKGPPRVVSGATDLPACPVCGCVTLFNIAIAVEDHPLLKTGTGTGFYVGCPACPFATPMLMVAGTPKTS